MNRTILAIATVGILLALGSQQSLGSVSSKSFVIQVYSDGSTSVNQSLLVSPNSPSVQVPILSEVLSDLVATDQNGAPLSFKITGSNITVYTLGASTVDLRYDTQNLTSKSGTVWTIDFTTSYNSTLVLPQLSTLSYISGTPYSLKTINGSPTAVIGPGTWEVKYGVAIGPPTSTSTNTTTSQQGPPGIIRLSSWQYAAVAIGAVAVAVGGIGLFWWRRRLNLGPGGADLRPDDVQVLNFIQESGGKVQESEIRTKFALPKTSAWRQIKRLERSGYVRVTRTGSQNQIELVKKRED